MHSQNFYRFLFLFFFRRFCLRFGNLWDIRFFGLVRSQTLFGFIDRVERFFAELKVLGNLGGSLQYRKT
jgi:hypothetical protein